MSPSLARWFLVPVAVLLVVAGFAASLGGPQRAVLLATAACCALLDAAVRRSPDSGPPRAPAGQHSRHARRITAPAGPDPVGGAARSDVDPEASGPGAGRSWSACASSELVLGTLPDGTRATLPVGPPGRSTHVVVLGRGALAEAVHRGLAGQLARACAGGPPGADQLASDRAAGSPDPDELLSTCGGGSPASVQPGEDLATGPGGDERLRWCSADDVARDVSTPVVAVPPTVPVDPTDGSSPPTLSSTGTSLPAGTSVAVGFVDDGPTIAATVVLVPGLQQLPRAWDALVEVSRYGCTLRTRDGTVARTIEPVLPFLGPDRLPRGATRSGGAP